MAGAIQRLIQFVLRGKDDLSDPAKKATEAMEALRAKTGELNQALDSAKDARGMVVGLANTERAITQTKTSIERAESTVLALREALDKNPDSKGFETSLKAAERDAANLRRTLDTLNTKHAEQQRTAREAGVDTSKLADEENRLASEVTKAKDGISQNAKALRDLERDQARAAREAANHVSRVTALRQAMASGVRQAAGYAAAFFGIQAAFGLVGKGIDLVRTGILEMLSTGDQFENLQNRLTSLMGTVEGGEQATAWIKRFAKDTPLQLSDVTDAFALLKAYGVDPMNGSLKAIEDQSEKLGGGLERLEGISTALGQAWAKEKLQTEEILQLIERGVPVWDMLGKVTGKTTSQLQDLATKGKLGRDVIKALIDEMGRSSEGAAAKAMGTLTGLVSNLADTATDFLGRIANSGALDYAKNKLKELGQTIAQMDADGRLDKLAKGLSDAFVQGAEWVGNFIKQMAEVDFGTLVDKTSTWLSGFSASLDEMATKVKLFVAPFRTLFNGLTTGLSGIALAFTSNMGLMVSVIETIAAKIPEALGGEEIRRSVAGVSEMLAGLSEGFKSQIQQDAKDIADAWKTSADESEGAVQQQAQAITEHFGDLKASAQDSTVASVQAVTSLQNALDQISSATSVAQLNKLQEEMQKAYSAGTIKQEEYANGAVVLNAKLKELKGAAGSAALGISDLSTGLESLKDVQDAISNARTSVDIQNIRTALNKLYNDGTIKAADFNRQQEELSKKTKELKDAGATGAEGMDQLAGSTDQATKSLEEQRKEMGEALEAHRKGLDDNKEVTEGAFDFFGDQLAAARQPLAELSDAALRAFDSLQGLSSAELKLDTSSVESTEKSLEQIRQSLADIGSISEVGMGGFGRWAVSLRRNSLQMQEATLEQKQSLLELLDEVDRGDTNLQNFLTRATAARNSLGLLNDSDLRQLEGAIDSARQRMQQFQEGSKQTLTSLQEELAGLRGEQEALDRSKFAGRKADLQKQIADAQAAGDPEALQNLQRAMATLRQIESETNRQREQEAQTKLVEERNKAAPVAEPPAATPPTTRVIRFETPQGAKEVTVASEADETNLLGVLEQFRGRASG